MPTVKFATGQSVKFAKNPTPQDIEEVANKLNINKKAQPTGSGTLNKISNAVGDAGNILGDIAKKAIQAPVQLSQRVGQLGALGVAKALPGIFDYNKALDQVNRPNTVPGLNITTKPISQETPESMAGQGISTIALGAPGGKFSGAVSGGLGAGGYAMQENKGPAEVAAYTGVGALGGHLLQKATGSIASMFNKGNPVDDALVGAGASTPDKAPIVTNTLKDMGITNVTSPQGRAIAINKLENSIAGAREILNDFRIPSTASVAQEAQRDLLRFTMAQKALQQLGRVPEAAPAAPGLVGKVMSGAGRAGAGLLKFAAGGAALAGVQHMLQDNTPKNIIRKTLSGGSL